MFDLSDRRDNRAHTRHSKLHWTGPSTNNPAINLPLNESSVACTAMSHPRIEEVSDSDPEIDDPSDFLPGEYMRPADGSRDSDDNNNDTHHAGLRTSFTPSNLPAKAAIPEASLRAPQAPSQLGSNTNINNPTLLRPPIPQSSPSEADTAAKRAQIKPYITLYPIYFSADRTRKTGRRVSSRLATPNPLAFNILKASRSVCGPNLAIAFEPDKTHPKDWSNPGRVKIKLFDPDTKTPLHPTIRNKRVLYARVAEVLQANPTKPEDPLEFRVQGLPVPDGFVERGVAVPRGWKMGTVVPLHSAAVSGGGVSDNFLKEAMEEMRLAQANGHQLPGAAGMPDMSALAGLMGGMGGGNPSAGGGGGTTKKEKKKK